MPAGAYGSTNRAFLQLRGRPVFLFPPPSSLAMAHASTETLLRTPLYEAHQALGAKLVPFAGWEMPLDYGSILNESRAVRTGAGVFDVSHMGQIRWHGADRVAFLEKVTHTQF